LFDLKFEVLLKNEKGKAKNAIKSAASAVYATEVNYTSFCKEHVLSLAKKFCETNLQREKYRRQK
jgi:hypothetical protein